MDFFPTILDLAHLTPSETLWKLTDTGTQHLLEPLPEDRLVFSNTADKVITTSDKLIVIEDYGATDTSNRVSIYHQYYIGIFLLSITFWVITLLISLFYVFLFPSLSIISILVM